MNYQFSIVDSNFFSNLKKLYLFQYPNYLQVQILAYCRPRKYCSSINSRYTKGLEVKIFCELRSYVHC